MLILFYFLQPLLRLSCSTRRPRLRPRSPPLLSAGETPTSPPPPPSTTPSPTCSCRSPKRPVSRQPRHPVPTPSRWGPRPPSRATRSGPCPCPLEVSISCGKAPEAGIHLDSSQQHVGLCEVYCIFKFWWKTSCTVFIHFEILSLRSHWWSVRVSSRTFSRVDFSHCTLYVFYFFQCFYFIFVLMFFFWVS